MKRLICMIMATGLLLITVSADLLWEPENSFYKRNQKRCEPEERVYWVNGPVGYVTIREEPDGEPLVNVKNGECYYVYGTYEKGGKTWGLVNFRIGSVNDAGDQYLAVVDDLEQGYREAWVPMSEMTLKYDHICFAAEHPDEIREEAREISLSQLNYCTYEVPCGPLIFHQEQAFRDLNVNISLIYTDEQGREWGYCSYFYQDEVWFCLDDLENPSLQTVDYTPELIPVPENGEGTELPDWEDGPSLAAWIMAEVFLCGLTAVLIFFKGKKERKRT